MAHYTIAVIVSRIQLSDRCGNQAVDCYATRAMTNKKEPENLALFYNKQTINFLRLVVAQA